MNRFGFTHPPRPLIGRDGAARLGSPYILAQSAVAVSVTETTSEETLVTITVPANAMGPNGSLWIMSKWTTTNGADDKILRVRFSGASGSQYLAVTATTTVSAKYLTEIANRNATNSQVGGPAGTSNWGALGTAFTTSSANTTAATTIVITGQKETGTDTLTLESYLVILHYGA